MQNQFWKLGIRVDLLVLITEIVFDLKFRVREISD